MSMKNEICFYPDILSSLRDIGVYVYTLDVQLQVEAGGGAAKLELTVPQ